MAIGETMYYDKEGKEIEALAWGILLSREAYKRVAADTLKNGYRVSTMWLGIDHGFSGGPPLIFETIVLSGPPSWHEFDSYRYSTLKEAQAGHIAMVKKWSKGVARKTPRKSRRGGAVKSVKA